MLSIGEFARASRLTPKALRLYDELGLLPPAYVDPDSGYRYYEREQLERARLVAWLRRLGMPLARIRRVCELAPADAAAEVAAYWARVKADTAARGHLAAFLVDDLSRKDTAMSYEPTTLAVRHAVQSDRGRVREVNQDVAFAGGRLLAVADGFGPSGEAAAAGAVEALKPLDTGVPAGDLLNTVADAVHDAATAVREAVDSGERGTSGTSGTTLTAMLWTGSHFALVNLGDTRVYLLRDGELSRLTNDHTMVASLVEEGRLTPEEADAHPDRAILARALGSEAGEPDIQLHPPRAGDRYLVCTDGLWSVVPATHLRQVLSSASAPDTAVRELIAHANEAGGPDNIACVVADVVSSSP